MKVAFLFSGQFREIPSDLMKNSLENLTKDINYDIFCYSWDEPGESLDHREIIPVIKNKNDSFNQISHLFREFNLVKIKTESYKKFLNNIPTDHKKIFRSNKYHPGTINSLPQIYTLSKCYELMSARKNEYDLIFRCRFDSIYIHPLNLYPLKQYAESSFLYNINFGRAYYPRRVYDIFFGGSSRAMNFLEDFWDNIPQLLENKFDNGQDRRDACRLIFLSANLKKIQVKSFRTRICDIYRPIKNDYYEKYLISSHLLSLKFNKLTVKSLKFFFRWIKIRRLNLFKILLVFIVTFILIPFSYLKRAKYFFKIKK